MNTKLKKHIISIAILPLLMGVAMLFYSCENDISVIKSLKIDENTPIESSYDIIMEYSDSGIVKLKLKSPEVHKYQKEELYMEMPEGVNVTFFTMSGTPRSTLKANYAVNYIDRDIMEARINVVATNNKGQKLYTEELVWNQKTKEIYTDKQVKVVEEGRVIFGDGLRSDENFEEWEILHPHDGEFEFDE